MKRLSLVLLASALLSACTTAKDAYDIRPDDTADKTPTAVEWQNSNDAELAARTKPDVLVKFVESPAAADALLAQVGAAYAGDPFVLTQIACVSQLVMCPKCPKAPGYRKVWVAALKRARDAAQDGYVKTFCDQQLWWCGDGK